jgi:molybdate transport system regulatory protein
MATPPVTYSLKLRILQGREIAFGPGKAELLDQIRATGSIAAAGRAMGMSYKRAWDLVETMNRCFTAQLVEKSKGGADHGGATVTPLGEEVLARYRALADAADRAVHAGATPFPGLEED